MQQVKVNVDQLGYGTLEIDGKPVQGAAAVEIDSEAGQSTVVRVTYRCVGSATFDGEAQVKHYCGIGQSDDLDENEDQ